MKSSCLLSVIAVSLTAPLFGQNQPPNPRPAAPAAPALPNITLTPAQTAHIMKEMEKVEAQIGQGRGSVFAAALAKFKAATSSDSAAMALYLDCYKLENYERKNLKQADFMEWRERNAERLKAPDLAKGLALQLEYLVLTIQAQGVAEMKDMGGIVSSLQGYLAKVIVEVQASMKHTASGAVELKDASAKGAAGGGRKGGPGPGNGRWGAGEGSPLTGILRQSVKSSEFSSAYMLDDYLTRRDWEYSPLNIDGVYANIILPYYKEVKPDELGAQWDSRINAELALRKAVLSETEFSLFQQMEQPRLQWQKHQDLLASNINSLNALADMLKTIQNNPNHPDAAGWLSNFKKIMATVAPPEPAEKPIGTQ